MEECADVSLQISEEPFIFILLYRRRHGVTSLQVPSLSSGRSPFIFPLQNHVQIFFRFSSFSGCFRVFQAWFCPGFRHKNGGGESREGLTAFPKSIFLWFFDCEFCPEKLLFLCRKALLGLQRGRFESLAAAPLHCRKALVAEP